MRALLVYPERERVEQGSTGLTVEVTRSWHLGIEREGTAAADLLCGRVHSAGTQGSGHYLVPQGGITCVQCLNALLRYLSLTRGD